MDSRHDSPPRIRTNDAPAESPSLCVRVHVRDLDGSLSDTGLQVRVLRPAALAYADDFTVEIAAKE